MSRLPVRPLAGALISALVIVMTSMLTGAPALAVPAPVTRSGPAVSGSAVSGSAVELDTDLTLLVAKCEGCVITLESNDGITAAYSSLPAIVTSGSVTITLPSTRTAGMSVRIKPTWVTVPGPDTFVAWRYNGESIGATMGLKQARAKRRASGCWAGTVNEAVTLTIKVRQISRRGRAAAIAWAPTTESFLPPMQRSRGGVLTSGTGLSCKTVR